MATDWDPGQYNRFATERARPFHELVARIPAHPSAVAVVDLGCGTGALTATLAPLFPEALILGIDSSPSMITAAAAAATDRVSFKIGDLAAYRPQRGSLDVIVANASLQWVPRHDTLLPVLAAALDDGGTLAFQVPVRGPSFGAITGPRGDSPVQEPLWYVQTLAGLGLTVDVWETTYFHVLPGDDAVFEWFAGTGLRPFLQTATADEVETLKDRLRSDYPKRDFGTVLPFPRLFVIASRS